MFEPRKTIGAPINVYIKSLNKHWAKTHGECWVKLVVNCKISQYFDGNESAVAFAYGGDLRHATFFCNGFLLVIHYKFITKAAATKFVNHIKTFPATLGVKKYAQHY